MGNFVIRKLTELKIGQPIRTADEVHKLAALHEGKGGTPTMGGVLILSTILLSTLLWARPTSPFIWALWFILLVLGALGFMDDYQKVAKKNSKGVSARGKLIIQVGASAIAGAFLYFYPSTHEYMADIRLPMLKTPIEIKEWGIWLAAILSVGFFTCIIVGSSNAVNLTDGLDGLAIGCTVVAAMTFSIFSYVAGHKWFADHLSELAYHPQAGEVAVFCMAMVGAGVGFLWFNCHPARVFMGDTGSLSLGGLLGVIAISSRQEFVLILVGGVFVIEAMSVILQVASFKMRGKRIFRMAPIHHHFELMGWKETKVIVRFWILAIMFALAALATLKIR
ncbi:MAG: phospho-N-acetylmuramoyl-pentapeptide-transferase [Verrucomicrobiota bacterium]